MLGNREENDTRKRILVETLRYLQDEDPEKFEEYKNKLEETDVWEQFEREYNT